jgi:hypothetical protein
MRTPTTYDMVFLADNEWGNQIMREVASEWFSLHPGCNFVYVYEHAGWSLTFHRDNNLECVGSANDMAVFRKDRPRPTGGSGFTHRRKALRPDIQEVTTLQQYVQPAPVEAELLAA